MGPLGVLERPLDPPLWLPKTIALAASPSTCSGLPGKAPSPDAVAGMPRHREINHWDDGRGVYFDDPNGHLLEIITRPYGSGGTEAKHPHPLIASRIETSK